LKREKSVHNGVARDGKRRKGGEENRRHKGMETEGEKKRKRKQSE